MFKSDSAQMQSDATPVWQTRLRVADRHWELSIFPTEAYLLQHRPWLAWGVGVIGLMLAALLQIVLLAVTGRAILVERQVTEKTDEIRRNNAALARSEERYRSVVDNVT